MVEITPIKNAHQLRLFPDDYAVFGGTFDPFHKGHLSVVLSLMKLFSFVAIAPTKQNPWKEEWASSYNHRLEMIRLIALAEQLPLSESASDGDGVYVANFPYEYAEEAVHWWREARPGRIYWAVGEDSAAGVSAWRNWEELEVTTISAPILHEVHATEIRQGKITIHPAILNYVKKHNLYGY